MSPFQISGSSTSFVISVGDGTLFNSTGTPIEYSGGTLTVPANSTYFVYFNTVTQQPVLSAAYDDSVGILIGRVEASEVGIERIVQSQSIVNASSPDGSTISQAGDLQDLASFGVFDGSVADKVRVLRDPEGNPFPTARIYSKAPDDDRTSNGITIVLPIDVQEPYPGRWVLEGYEA